MIPGMIFKPIRAKRAEWVEAYQVFMDGFSYLGELYLIRGGLDSRGTINRSQLRWSSGNGRRFPTAEQAVSELLLKKAGQQA